MLRDGAPVSPGEIGEVVITDLNNYCMPFIRYRIGDLAEAMAEGGCACGRGAPRLGAIEGRVQSIIQGADGRYLPGTFFAHYLKEYDHAIKRFQVIQEERDAMTFRVVKGGRFSDDVLAEVLHTFRHYLGERMRIDVEFVDEVAMVRTGKRLASVSRLGVDFQKAAPRVIAEASSARRNIVSRMIISAGALSPRPWGFGWRGPRRRWRKRRRDRAVARPSPPPSPEIANGLACDPDEAFDGCASGYCDFDGVTELCADEPACY